MSFVPTSADAATKKPTCSLIVTTEQGEAKITKKGGVIVTKGSTFEIAWDSKNAEEAELNGKEIDLSDSEDFSPTKKTTYKFVFTDGTRKATCAVTAHVVEGSIEEVSSGSKPTLSGESSGLKKVTVSIYKEGNKKVVFQKKNIKVKGGEWEVEVTKTLAEGKYEVRLMSASKLDLNIVTTANLTVGDKNTLSSSSSGSSAGVLSVSSIPLLSGGSTSAGQTVPVSYLQLRNTGKEVVTVTGFKVKQNGSASANGITNLSTVDDKGGSRATSPANPFKDGIGLAPTTATIEPGTMKLFTIKATLGMSVTNGTNLMLDVIGVESNGSEKGTFPIRGTTWTIGY